MNQKKFFLTTIFCLLMIMQACDNKPTSESGEALYLNPEAPVNERVVDLMARMSLEEKVGQMCQFVSPSHMKAAEGNLSPEEIRKSDAHGFYPGIHSSDILEMIQQGKIGSFLHVENIEEANELQKMADSSRLRIPLLMGIDAIHGHGMYKDGSTIFPSPITLASSWDTSLVKKISQATAKEMRATGYHWTFSPMVEVSRDARWGRIGETFGEDPWLVGLMGRAMVQGYQEKDFSKPTNVIACSKHFVGGSEPVNGLNFAPLDVSERQLREIWLKPYKMTAEAGVYTFMAAHNEIFDVPCHANSFILTDVLKKEWGFNGFVVSDWTDVKRLHTLHKIAESVKEADKLAVNAGIDMHMHGPGFYDEVIELVTEGKIPEQRIDEAVKAILYAKFQLGLFENRYVDHKKAEKVVLSKEHKQLALEATRKSIVLLKNNGILPLSKEPRKIFITGPNANNQTVVGDWVLQQPDENIITLLEGLKQAAPESEIDYYQCGDHRNISDKDIQETKKRAAKADVCILAVGENSLRYQWNSKTCGENSARADIQLPGRQQELVEAAHSVGKPVIAVLINGRPLALTWCHENVDAIIEGWEPGMFAGQVISEVLFGDVNPSGKLTIHFPYSVGHIGTVYSHKPGATYRNYMFAPTKALYEFGHGLSYTTFKYSNLQVPEKVTNNEDFIVKVNVKNTGKRAGDEIVILYVNDVYSSVTTPVKELKAFKRVSLESGEEKTVELRVNSQQLALLNKDMNWVVEPGKFEIFVGNQKGSFVVEE